MNEKKLNNGPGRPARIANPRRAITSAAAAGFAEKGFDNTSLQEIAVAVSMTKAGLYHYFQSKEELFDAIVMEVLTEMTAEGRKASDTSKPAPQRLQDFLSAHATYFDANRDKFIASFVGRAGEANTRLSEAELLARREYVDIFIGILEDGRKTGAFEFDDASTMARGILGMLNWMARWYRRDGTQSPQQIVQGYTRMLLKGLRPDNHDQRISAFQQ